MSDANSKYVPRPGFIPGAVRNLGGMMLVLAPLALGKAREWEANFKAAAENKAASAEDAFHLQAHYIHDSLLRNYPDMEFEHLLGLLDTHNVVSAVEAVATQSGMVKSPGEIPQPGTAP